MTARQLLEARVAELRAKDLERLCPPVQTLADTLGDVELTDETTRFLVWFQNWDYTSLVGLAQLLIDRDKHIRVEDLERKP